MERSLEMPMWPRLMTVVTVVTVTYSPFLCEPDPNEWCPPPSRGAPPRAWLRLAPTPGSPGGASVSRGPVGDVERSGNARGTSAVRRAAVSLTAAFSLAASLLGFRGVGTHVGTYRPLPGGSR